MKITFIFSGNPAVGGCELRTEIESVKNVIAIKGLINTILDALIEDLKMHEDDTIIT